MSELWDFFLGGESTPNNNKVLRTTSSCITSGTCQRTGRLTGVGGYQSSNTKTCFKIESDWSNHYISIVQLWGPGGLW